METKRKAYNPSEIAQSIPLVTTMRNMERAFTADPYTFPNIAVDSFSSDNAGTTYAKKVVSKHESGPELEVLKAILNREGYLARLQNAVRMISKKFKPEVSELLDLVRAASLDVVEAILRWREAKKDHDAAFMWNGINYLIKMPSDLDYLFEYKAIKKWIGYSLIRNPFCIPYPLEDGAALYAENVLDAICLIEESDGKPPAPVVADLAVSTMRGKYTPHFLMQLGQSANLEKTMSVRRRLTQTLQMTFSNVDRFEDMDSDMILIRQAELIILKEEEKYGKHSRDSQGRVVPFLQAEVERTERELSRDDLRPLNQAAASLSHAPHAVSSEVGVIDEPWVPGPVWTSKFSQDDVVTKKMDSSLIAHNRGNVKIGGHLAAIDARCTESRQRRPLIPSIMSKMEFSKFRKLKRCSDRLTEIEALKNDVINNRLVGFRNPGDGSVSSRTSKKSPPRSRAGTMRKSRKTGSVSSNASASSRSTAELDQQSIIESLASVEDSLDPATADALKDLRILSSEETIVNSLMRFLRKRDKLLYDLKLQERDQRCREKSRDIERKRRLLTTEQGRRRGPPPPEPPNIYDFFAVIIQTSVRGLLARRYTERYRNAFIGATMTIQARARGYITRYRRWVMLKQSAAAVNIQRNYRGWKSRGTSAALAKESSSTKSAIMLQRVWRGVLGRRRCLGKKALDQAAHAIRGCVDPENLFSSDIKELARRIQYAIEEPLSTTFPPPEVLELIRLVTLVMQGSRGMLGLVEYSFINTRHYQEVDGETMTWELAAKILNRSERYIRMIRAMAYAPSSKPPRIISVPNNVQLLYAIQLKNPNWNAETFKSFGSGSKVCINLFQWLSSMVEIAIRQQDFLSFLGSSFPDWLPKYTEYQRVIRLCQFRSAMDGSILTALKEYRDRIKGDSVEKSFVAREISHIRKEIATTKEELLETMKQQSMLKDDQGKREDYALTAMDVKTHEMMKELRDISVKYQDTLKKAEMGDKRALAEVGGLKAKVTHAQMNITEMDAQFRMLTIQCSQNQARRREEGHLLPEIRMKAIAAGEAKSQVILASIKSKVLMKQELVSFPEDLEPHKYREYKAYKEEEERLWNLYRQAFVAADSHRQEIENTALDALHEVEEQEHQSKNKIAPSESDLAEERLEDDEVAKAERIKRRQFVPDHVWQAPKERPRPVLVCLSRDMPAYAKQLIYNEVVKTMPGLFVSMDTEIDMGLDLIQMQAILSDHKSIIAQVDHGLSRISRTSFLKTLELVVVSLIPTPVVVLAIGDDMNKRMAFGDAHFGVSKTDLSVMKDGDIKVCLEGMAWAIHELRSFKLQRLLQEYCSLIHAPSLEFLLVAEALLVLQSEEERFQGPDGVFQAQSWRIIQRFISQPSILVESLRTIRRGRQSARRVEVISCYLDHPLWPTHGSTPRQGDAAMHIMAYFVEQWFLCESLTRERGGIPVRPLTRGAFPGVESVVVVSDIADGDPDDLTTGLYNDTVGWRMATARVVTSCLKDLNVYKAAKYINGVAYKINAYREKEMVYFDAYDPLTSQLYSLSIHMTAVPKLLMPSPNPKARHSYPHAPQTRVEMYKRLSELLDIKKVLFMANSKKMMTIRREIVFMHKMTTRLNGHIVQIQAYEAVLGEIVFKVFVSEFSSSIEFTLTEDLRLKLYEYADPDLERTISAGIDGPAILPFVLDRMQLQPDRTMVTALGGTMTRSYARKHSEAVQKKSQGLSLSINYRHSIGKRLYRNIARFAGVLYFLVVKSVTATKIMRVVAYEPTSQKKVELQMSPFIRRFVNGNDGDNPKMWIEKLKKRLRISLRGEGSISVDLTVYKAIHKIAGHLCSVKIELVDEGHLRLQVTDPTVGQPWVGDITADQVVLLINSQIARDRDRHELEELLYKKEAAAAASTRAARDKQKAAQTARAPSPTKAKPKRDLHKGKAKAKAVAAVEEVVPEFDGRIPEASFISNILPPPARVYAFERSRGSALHDSLSLESIRLDSLASDKSLMRLLAFSLEPVLVQEKFSSNGAIIEYCLAASSVAEFKLMPSPEFLSSKSMDLDLSARHGPLLHPWNLPNLETLPAGGTWSVIKARKQMSWFKMEDQLQELAKENDRKAQEVEVQMAIANRTLHEAMMEIEEPRDRSRAIKRGCIETMAHMLQALETKSVHRELERSNPGITMELKQKAERKAARRAEKERETLTDFEKEKLLAQKMQEKEIVAGDEKLVYEAPCRATFRDQKSRWHGQVKVKVYESTCWFAETGPGRRLRFQVFDPQTSSSFSGLIRNSKELADILGPHAVDLLDKIKISEMVPFVVKFRMFLGKILYDEEGNLLDHLAPVNYRVEFDAAALEEGEEDFKSDLSPEAMAASKSKLQESEIAKGKKLLRISRRVSGLLLHLSFYEVSVEDKDASEKGSKSNSRRGSTVRKGSATRKGSTSGRLNSISEGAPLTPGAASTDAAQQSEGGGLATGREAGKVEDDYDDGCGEVKVVKRQPIYEAPNIRVLAFEPNTKAKANAILPAAAVMELVGGVYSPFLDVSQRRDLAKIVADSVFLQFPKGQTFQLMFRWSATINETAISVASTKNKNSWITDSVKIPRFPGTLCRQLMRVTQMEMMVVMYMHPPKGFPAHRQLKAVDVGADDCLFIYLKCNAAAEAVTIQLTVQEQVERIDRRLIDNKQGDIRLAAAYRLTKFLKASLDEHESDYTKKVLKVELQEVKFGFWADFVDVGHPSVEDSRPVGVPQVFMPLDKCGYLIHRRGMLLRNRDPRLPSKDYLVSVHTKSQTDHPTAGLIIKLYQQDTEETLLLHVGGQVVADLCKKAGQFTLLDEICEAIEMGLKEKLDSMETELISLTDKGDLVNKSLRLLSTLCDIILPNVGIYCDANRKNIPYLSCMPKGIAPV